MKVLVVALVAVLAIGGATVSLRQPDSTFEAGNFESGDLSGWRERQCLEERISVDRGRPAAAEGDLRARLEVRDGDVEPQTGSERCELVGPSLPHEGERWYRQAFFMPSEGDPPDSWQIISQWYSNYGGSPPLALFQDMDLPMRLSLRSGDSTRLLWRSDELPRDEWHEIVVGVYLSESPSRGWVEVWLDGEQQTLENGRTRMRGQTRGATRGSFKTGIYRDPDSEVRSILYLDDVAVGSSRDSVLND